MRVGVLVHDLSGGGAEGVARAWATHLAGRGHDVVLLLYGHAAAAATPGDLAAAVFPARSAAARWTLLPLWLRREAARRELDVVLSVLDFSNVVALVAALGTGRPVVISEHAAPSLLWRHKGASGRVKRAAARLLYRRADLALAVSHAVATDLRVALHVPADRLVVLPNPVESAVRAPVPAPPADGGDSATGHRLLVVGRLAPEKQVRRALEVLRVLRARGLDWSGCVMGDGPLRAALEATARSEDLPVEFPGWVSPWQVRARPGDVLLVTSDLEGFGNVLVEAAGAGVPVVAPSPALGVADALLPELTGVLSPTTRTDDLADAVVRAAGLAGRAGSVGPWLERFRPETAAARLEAVLERVVRPGAPARTVVTHVGPAPDAQGGIASVLRTYRDAGVPGWTSRFLTSYTAGGALWSAGPALRALLRLLSRPADELGVVHVHVSFGGSFVREGALAAVASARGCPVVVTVHGSSFTQWYADHPRLAHAVLRRADRVVLLGEHHRSLLPPDLQERAVVVPNTVTADGHVAGALPQAPRALFAGELSRRKGLDVLLAAWPRVLEQVPAAELVLAGPPGDVAPVDLPGVRWAGPLPNPEVRALLRASRVAVLPSRREVMPMFVLEAMSAGRAVVATPVGAVAETVGDAAVLVPVGDADALAQALVGLLRPGAVAERIGAAARQRFAARFSLEQSMQRLRTVYETTHGHPAPDPQPVRA